MISSFSETTRSIWVRKLPISMIKVWQRFSSFLRAFNNNENNYIFPSLHAAWFYTYSITLFVCSREIWMVSQQLAVFDIQIMVFASQFRQLTLHVTVLIYIKYGVRLEHMRSD